MSFHERFIEYVNKSFLKTDKLSSAIHYSLLPAGKLFRPNLFLSLCRDLKISNLTLDYFGLFLEYHHVYTLIHDDLPCMDDDDFRRGKESTHKKFNEGIAVLAGDALLNESYHMLGKLDCAKEKEFITEVSELLGYKGLILGQVLDLYEDVKDIKDIISLHTLKTARLIQCACLGAYHFSDLENPLEKENFLKFGLNVGMFFQIEDDLEDYNQGERKTSNIFVNYESQAHKILEKSKIEIKKFLDEKRFFVTKQYLKNFREV